MTTIAPAVESVGDTVEVAEQQQRLGLGPARPFSTEQDQRRLAPVAGGEQRTEVGVGRDEHAGLGGGRSRMTASAAVLSPIERTWTASWLPQSGPTSRLPCPYSAAGTGSGPMA